MRGGDQRRAVLALGASAAVHLAAGVALARLARQQAPAAPRREGPVEIVMVQRRVEPRPAAVGAPGPGAAPGPRRGTATTVRLRAGAGPGAGAGAGPGAGAGAGAGAAPGTPAWLEAEGLAPAEAAPKAGFLGPVHGADLGTGGEAERAPTAGEGGDRAGRIRARLDATLQEVLAADRARTLPDAYWMRLRDRLEQGLEVAWEVLERGPGDDRVVSGHRVGQALAAWQREAERWARQGRPNRSPEPEEDEAAEARRTLAERGLAGGEPGARSLFLTELVARVELEQGVGGRVAALRIVGGSGNAAYDALVLEHVRRLAEQGHAELGPVPEQGSRTEWSVRSRFEMTPPAPVVGCSFDALFRPAGCFYPLKRTVRSSVRLERVWVR